ncbi:MAG TPA: hypothetical protein VFW40_11710, partial [Capsulimonadaceae bacterium]|nr:hypothetical protein [Capsulimonadaceae bacterium]
WIRGLLKWLRFGVSASLLALLPIGLAFYPQQVEQHPGKAFGTLAWILVGCGAFLAIELVLEKIESDRADKGPLARKTFSERYPQNLKNALDTIADLDKLDAAQLDRIKRSLLRIICSFVVEYRDIPNRNDVNANVMEAVKPNIFHATQSHGELHFGDPNDKQSYEMYLRLTQWAFDHHDVPHPFSLPVAKDRKRLLFGAPKAFAHGTHDVVGDTQTSTFKKELMDLLAGQPKSVEDQIKAFFKARDFRSFVSICLDCGNEKRGVLNVNSSKVGTFGNNKEPDWQLLEYIAPFCGILCLVIQKSTQAAQSGS